MTTTDWVALARGTDKLWPAPDGQTILGHLTVILNRNRSSGTA